MKRDLRRRVTPGECETRHKASQSNTFLFLLICPGGGMHSAAHSQCIFRLWFKGNIFNTILLDLCKKARVSRLLLGFLSLLNRKSFYRATLKELKGGGCLRMPLFSIMQKSSGASFIA